MSANLSGFGPTDRVRTTKDTRVLLETARENETEEPGAVAAALAIIARSGVQLEAENGSTRRELLLCPE